MKQSGLPEVSPGVRFTGSGLATPSRVLTNADLEKMVDTSDEWIVQRSGIRQRYISAEGDRCADLATRAVDQAVKNAGLAPTDLDLVIAATMTPDTYSPTVSCEVVANLGAVPCGAMDINLACTGFVAGLNTAASLIRSGMYRHIALVGCEQMSRLVNWTDRRTCVLFGDGAGAVILSACDDPAKGCIYQRICSDGLKSKELYVPRTSADVVNPDDFNGQLGTVQMNGREVYKFAVKTMYEYLASAMKHCGLEVDDVSLVVPHQSNERIIEAARERLGLRPEQVYINIGRFGNTSAASVGICLHELMEARRLKDGDVVIFIGVGAGVTWATSVWRM